MFDAADISVYDFDQDGEVDFITSAPEMFVEASKEILPDGKVQFPMKHAFLNESLPAQDQAPDVHQPEPLRPGPPDLPFEGEFKSLRRECFRNLKGPYGWMQQCFESFKEFDSDPLNDWWGLHVWIIAASNKPVRLELLKQTVSEVPLEKSDTSIFKYSPDVDLEQSPCNEIELSVGGRVGTLTGTSVLCEKWDVEGRDAGSNLWIIPVTWKPGLFVVSGDSRKIDQWMTFWSKEGTAGGQIIHADWELRCPPWPLPCI